MKSHTLKSAITISLVIIVMISVGYFINRLNSTATGATVAPICKCIEDNDCNDNNPCTEDFCLYKETCEAAICVNKEISDCKRQGSI